MDCFLKTLTQIPRAVAKNNAGISSGAEGVTLKCNNVPYWNKLFSVTPKWLMPSHCHTQSGADFSFLSIQNRPSEYVYFAFNSQSAGRTSLSMWLWKITQNQTNQKNHVLHYSDFFSFMHSKLNKHFCVTPVISKSQQRNLDSSLAPPSAQLFIALI